MSVLSTMPPRRRALVFSGGSLKGAAFIGALRALEEAGASFDMFGGASAGSIAAVLAGSGLPVRDMEQVLAGIAASPANRFRDYNVRGILSLLTLSSRRYLGLLKGDKLEQEFAGILERKGIARFSDLAAPVFTVAVNALDGRELVCTNLPRGDLPADGHVQDLPVATALRASTAIPGVFIPKFLGEGVYVDGGVRSYLPILVAQQLGAEEILGITFTQQAEERSQVLAGGFTTLLSRTIDLLMWDQLESDLALLHAREVETTVLTLAIEDPRLFDLRSIPRLVELGYEQTKAQIQAQPELLERFRD